MEAISVCTAKIRGCHSGGIKEIITARFWSAIDPGDQVQESAGELISRKIAMPYATYGALYQ